MTESLRPRTNTEWISALEGNDPASREAMEELRGYLHRVLAKVLVQHSLRSEDIADLTQDALVRLLEYKHTFRGDSAFPTWATAVATRVAFTQLRKQSVRQRGRRAFELVREEAQASSAPDSIATTHELLRALHRAIESELTERQRVAILAELRGIPTIEIAEQLQTNQNALYKLVHDGRRKLHSALLASGYSAEMLHDFVRGAAE